MNKNKIFLSLFIITTLLASDDIKHNKNISTTLEELQVVPIVESDNPLKITSNPKNPIQPIPASDGADYLKNIPGFSVKRKGGINGDPIFRGMSGSKLGIFSDGQELYGGCSARMDPPTAYIYPQSYDSVVITKGPQTVLAGSGFSAGVVQFKNNPKYYSVPNYDIYSSIKQGSFGRNDQFIDISGGNSFGYGKLTASHSHLDDYKDAKGNLVNSKYSRWNTNLTLGYTQIKDTTIEISGSKGDGKARYADRTMDASKLLRENISLKAIRYNISKNIEQVELLVYRNYIDHIMDNYSLRNQSKPMNYSAMNPNRTTIGGNIKLTSSVPSLLLINESGIDFKNDIHKNRMVMMQNSSSLATSKMLSQSRDVDFKFNQIGFFNESTININENNRLVAGLRVDKHNAVDKRMKLGMSMMSPSNVNYNKNYNANLPSGFIRYEKDVPDYGLYSYIGIGHSQRFPDYWERIKDESNISNSEKTNQIDIGTTIKNGNLTTSASLFYSKIDDYILSRWFDINGNSLTSTKSYNIDATIYGGELSMSYQIANDYKITGLLTHVIGTNDTQNKPLAQQPPLEGKISLIYDNNKYSAGILARFIAKQNRYDIGAGSIVGNGADKGPTSGASIFSVNGGYKYNKYISLTLGIDNILNKNYTEHLSNSDISSGTTFISQEKIYEPGRNIWFELKTKF